ncbi:MAG: glycerophosphodiester phosphodiesterase, partial [Planctomycetes bacterium]|nr:glycerophosphodiester phosphodiesterase [Planctomycetota bacterium]
MPTRPRLAAHAILLLCLLLVAGMIQRADAVEIIAHRGASHSAPENTLSAVNLAWQRGAGAVEFDVWLTHDGRIVALHDETTERTTGKDWNVAEKTFAQLRALDAGSWKDPTWAGEKIPSLAELLATVPDGKRVFIEIKDEARLVPELERVVRASGKRPEQTVVISFDFAAVQAAKKRMPELCVYWIQGTSPKRDKRTGRLSAPPAELMRKCHAAG